MARIEQTRRELRAMGSNAADELLGDSGVIVQIIVKVLERVDQTIPVLSWV